MSTEPHAGSPPTTRHIPTVLKEAEVAQMLGGISVFTVRKLRRNGLLGYVPMGVYGNKGFRYLPEHVSDYLERAKRPAKAATQGRRAS
jgi:hypothetical protein